MSDREKYQYPLIDHLVKAVPKSPGSGQDSSWRKLLAALRASMAEGREATAYPVIGSFFHTDDRQTIDDYLLAAQLFALHPVHGGQSLGAAMRQVGADRASDSVELRFRALLDAEREDLDTHLRHAVSLARAGSQPIDYHDLLSALQRWRWENRPAQRAWARDYWFNLSSTDNEGNAS